METRLAEKLIHFIHHSPTPFHAVSCITKRLEEAGFQALSEKEAWHIEEKGRYYVTRNDSSIIVFKIGNKANMSEGFRMVGAHTDSPCLQVKPQPELNKHNYWQLEVDVYGGALLAPWFDRDLSLAGRVTYRQQGKIQSSLINFVKPIAIIPSLAIHLNREANKGWAINPQVELNPILATHYDKGVGSFKNILQEHLLIEHGLSDAELLDYELSFYDVQQGNMFGLYNELISSARLDNLLSCFASINALLEANDEENALVVLTDHEEVGSGSACGADGPFLEQVLQRLLPDVHLYNQCIQNSLLISVDNAHGVHPNYPQKHDENHQPQLNGGPVIKTNVNQRYASNSVTSGFFRNLCQTHGVPVQTFAMRSDMACGSTIGPITASQIGVKTVDVGVATLAMHSIRELAGREDLGYLVNALKAFYETEQLV